MIPPRGDPASRDFEDVERVLQGDTSAFENIVRRWQGPLVNLAYRFCRDRARAEDMAQEAFLRAYRGLKNWRREGSFSTWLFALATNSYRSDLRRIPARTVSLDEIADPPARQDPKWEDECRERAVRQAVATLPAKYREVLTLFYFLDKNVPGAAESLGLPEGTVKARLHRGREILRNKLMRLKEA